ncbi:putative transposase/invertase (TIGR01784 family) [Anaerobacterium chartisolvens]|uniref:Putative transposase/invertase (TIGR01784 family) n=1 Tax=Anaerobacterium chartisolvens TaxID=1297424 RepID=A0A369AVQ7_9FIRM|nr:Rpn family recombination-promoting nuclease/putative transposase [Anaerobacterium chartisolvens]RCX13480.1 putative transposase/invertase (TIGR01784 family) [Anaerobacterium chartisolvens]
MKRLKVKNDFIFQKIFGQAENKEILISFLNAVLELEAHKRLEDVEIIENTKLKKEGINDKLGILDIRAKTMLGEHINIEVQLVNQYNMDKRTIFYWSKMFTEQLKEGQPFNNLKKTITINILDFNYIDVDSYSTVFHLWEDTHKDCKLTDIMEIRFIELPKFRKSKPDLGKPLDRWLVFIEDSPEEVLEVAMREEPAIAKAENILEYLGSLDEIKRYYESREMAVHDEITRLVGAREEGLQEGMEKGIEKGIEKGLQEGIKIRNIQIVKNMRSLGMKDEDIAKSIGLMIDEVESIK